MLTHNNGWEIRFINGRYWIIPPPSIDPTQTPIAAQRRDTTPSQPQRNVVARTVADTRQCRR
jgi:hypothetical protein